MIQSFNSLKKIANRKLERNCPTIILGSDGLFSFFLSSEENFTSSSTSSALSSALSLSVGSICRDLDEALENIIRTESLDDLLAVSYTHLTLPTIYSV